MTMPENLGDRIRAMSISTPAGIIQHAVAVRANAAALADEAERGWREERERLVELVRQCRLRIKNLNIENYVWNETDAARFDAATEQMIAALNPTEKP